MLKKYERRSGAIELPEIGGLTNPVLKPFQVG
jgi:hypothetical protein